MGLLSAVLESAAVSGMECKMECNSSKDAEETNPAEVPEDPSLVLASVHALAAELTERLGSSRPCEAAAASRPRREALRLRLRALGGRGREPELAAAAARLARLDSLAGCFERLKAADGAFERRKFREASDLYSAVDSELNAAPPPDALAETAGRLATIVSLKRAKCAREVARLWRERIALSDDAREASVSVGVRDLDALQETLDALFASGAINREISRIADLVFGTAVPALVSGRGRLEIRRDPARVSVIVHKDGQGRRPADDLIAFFETLQTAIDYRWEDGRSVFSTLGLAAGGRLLDALGAVEDAGRLEEFFCEIGLVDRERPVPSPADPVVPPPESGRSNPLSRARDLMKTDPGEGVFEVCTTRTAEIQVDEMKLLEAAAVERDVSKDPFLMRHCRVSESVKKIMELIIAELTEGQKCGSGNKAISTVRNVLEMYCIFVPRYHANLLEKNPSDLALFHNNCLYLAHSIIGFPWSKVFNEEYSRNITMQLADQVQNLRIAAILKFSATIKAKQTQLEEVISKSEFKNLESSRHISGDAEIDIFNCLELLKNLQNCWQPILSVETYEKAMIQLIDSFSEQLVNIVLTIKEIVIEEELAGDLANVYQNVANNIPKLFPECSDFTKLSKNYQRLLKIIILLNQPMYSIATMWKSDTSPLSKLFSCEEIKHLIRILFPGSTQKSSVLDKIK